MSTFATTLEYVTCEGDNAPLVYVYVNRNTGDAGKAVRLDIEAEDDDLSAYLSRDGAIAVARALLKAAGLTTKEGTA